MADLIQPARPDVDAFVLELLDKRTFRASVFAETRSGVCKILALSLTSWPNRPVTRAQPSAPSLSRWQ